MRRGQTGISQTIVFVLALLIGSLVLIFGYISLQKVLKTSGEAEMMRFQSGLESELTSLALGSTRKKDLAVPGNYLSICFADLHYLRGRGEDEFTSDPDYAVVKDSVFSGVESNVFPMPDGTESFNVGDLEVQDGFVCFNLSAGHAEVGFEGMGNRTRVLPYNAIRLKPTEPEPTEQCGDGICQPTENFENCNADCPKSCVDESTIEAFDSYSHNDIPKGWDILSSKPQFGWVRVKSCTENCYKAFVSSPNVLRVYVSSQMDHQKVLGLLCWFDLFGICNSVAQKQVDHSSRERYTFDALFNREALAPGHIDISHFIGGHIFVGADTGVSSAFFHATNGTEIIVVGRMAHNRYLPGESGFKIDPDYITWHHFDILVDWDLGTYDLLITETETGNLIADKSGLKVNADDVSSGDTFTITQDGFGYIFFDNFKIESLCGG